MLVMTSSFVYLRYFGTHTKVSRLQEVPLEQTVVQDPELLVSINPSFYAGVQTGDLVMRFQNHIDLLRPQDSRLIRRVMIEP